MYAYQQLMEQNDLELSDLPADARVGIKTIQQIANAKKMTEARGQNVSEQVLNKIRANDKWVVREILDFIDNKETNTDDIPAPAAEVINQIKAEAPAELTPEQKLGQTIENELSFLHEQGDYFTADEIKQFGATKTYQTIFENYDNNGSNGVHTSTFMLDESDQKEHFSLNKK